MMTMFVLQVAIFIAVAFGLGCLFGCWLKGRLGNSEAAASVAHEGGPETMAAGKPAEGLQHSEPEASPQPKPAFAAAAETGEKPESVAAEPGNEDGTSPVRKPSRTKATKSPAGKAATSKAKASGSPARSARTEKASAAKRAAAKPAAAKPKRPKTSPAAADTPDNLKKIKGIGPQIEAKLNAAGINSFAQIAAWTKKQQAEFAEQLSFSGRIEREQWVSQAKILAKGGDTDFARRVEKGEVASSAGGKAKGGGKT